MSSFDFTALLKFLGSLFDAFMALFEKLGFSFDFGGETEGETEGEDTTVAEA